MAGAEEHQVGARGRYEVGQPAVAGFVVEHMRAAGAVEGGDGGAGDVFAVCVEQGPRRGCRGL
ncbi:hypothetical protein G4G28_05535 [Massilia sp. Dwa41.01b]|nr:hypothetical protein G4G28_05535 [Massilia sp. Dwa41.01b]